MWNLNLSVQCEHVGVNISNYGWRFGGQDCAVEHKCLNRAMSLPGWRLFLLYNLFSEAEMELEPMKFWLTTPSHVFQIPNCGKQSKCTQIYCYFNLLYTSTPLCFIGKYTVHRHTFTLHLFDSRSYNAGLLLVFLHCYFNLNKPLLSFAELRLLHTHTIETQICYLLLEHFKLSNWMRKSEPKTSTLPKSLESPVILMFFLFTSIVAKTVRFRL